MKLLGLTGLGLTGVVFLKPVEGVDLEYSVTIGVELLGLTGLGLTGVVCLELIEGVGREYSVAVGVKLLGFVCLKYSAADGF